VVRQAWLSDAAKFEGEGFYLFSESLTSPQSDGNDIFLPGAVVAVFATTFLPPPGFPLPDQIEDKLRGNDKKTEKNRKRKHRKNMGKMPMLRDTLGGWLVASSTDGGEEILVYHVLPAHAMG